MQRKNYSEVNMTDPSEIKISDAEYDAFWRDLRDCGPATALAAFLARRVPDAMLLFECLHGDGFGNGHNACRARVLKGE